MKYQFSSDTGYSCVIEADDLEEATDLAEDLVRDGTWPIEGIVINCELKDEVEDEYSYFQVLIEPDHEELIRKAGGDTNCEHEWSNEGEGGCDLNPGVWSIEHGNKIVFTRHCSKCGLIKTEVKCVGIKSPGDFDSVEYRQS